jgi:hypothetical protein
LLIECDNLYLNDFKKNRNNAAESLKNCLCNGRTGIFGTLFGDHDESLKTISDFKEFTTDAQAKKICQQAEQEAEKSKNIQVITTLLIGLPIAVVLAKNILIGIVLQQSSPLD